MSSGLIFLTCAVLGDADKFTEQPVSCSECQTPHMFLIVCILIRLILSGECCCTLKNIVLNLLFCFVCCFVLFVAL